LQSFSNQWKANREWVARVLESTSFHPACSDKLSYLRDVKELLRLQVEELERTLEIAPS
jgi:hypothetical protein